MILAGDVGGTNTRLALFEVAGGSLRVLAAATFPSRAHRGLEELVARFVAERGGSVRHACFGVAGPVRDGRCEATNLPWVVDGQALGRELALPAVTLINDLEANAYGLATLGPDDVAVLNAGEPGARGNVAVIAAGTGLGEAGLVWDGRRHQPFASEGGHADFAPTDELQVELYRFLARELGHVSVERVLSGPGLYNVYRFLRDTGRGEEPGWLAAAIGAGDPAPVISAAALDGRSELCGRALDVVVSIYGAEAGNLALRVLATAGVYLGGGIGPRIRRRLEGPRFMEAFLAKGRLRALLSAIPVRLILNDRTALQGAARCAALRAGLTPEGGQW